MPSSRRLFTLAACVFGFVALGVGFSTTAAADTYQLLLSADRTHIAYGDRFIFKAELSVFVDSCSTPFVPGAFTLEVNGVPVSPEGGWVDVVATCNVSAPQPFHVRTRLIDDFDIHFGTHAVTVAYTPDGGSQPVARSTPFTVVVDPGTSGTTQLGTVQAAIASLQLTEVGFAACSQSSVQVLASSSVGEPPGTRSLDAGVVHFQGSGCGDAETCLVGIVCPPPVRSLPFAGTPQQRLLLRMPVPIPANAQFWIYSTGPGTTPGWKPINAQVQGSDALITVSGATGRDALSGFVAMTVRPKFSLAVQDMWWAGPEENGWGLSIAQHGDGLFVGLYIYRDDGTPEWLIMPLGSWNTNGTAYTGMLYEPKGSWFGAFDSAAVDVGSPVGQARIAFSSDSTATLDYTVRGVTGSKSIRRQPFGSSTTPPVQGNRAGLWWAGAQRAGWGLHIGHQGNTLFSTWYTYSQDGSATWRVMPGGTWTDPDTYTGAVYRTHGSRWLAAPYDPKALTVTPVGTMTLHFTGPATGTMSYSVDGISGSETITLQPF